MFFRFVIEPDEDARAYERECHSRAAGDCLRVIFRAIHRVVERVKEAAGIARITGHHVRSDVSSDCAQGSYG